MSRLILSNDYVKIYDDFLPKEAFEPLLARASSDSYSIVHQDSWQKSWRHSDGLPLSGTSVSDQTVVRDVVLSAFVEALRNAAADAEAVIGRRGDEWDSITFKPYVHPLGCGLSLHRDLPSSFAYYLHHAWNFHWGGHLLVFDPGERLGLCESFLSDAKESRIVSEPGLALCVLPKPNRLVFLRRDTYHMVTRVDARAGDRPRVSIAGFFLARPAGESS